MIETNEVVIKYTENSDIPGVIACMRANLFDNIDNKRQGRLFYKISESEFKTFVGNPNNIFLCARQGNDVLGYVLAYNLKDWIYTKPTRLDDIQVSPDMKEKLTNEKILYGRHIAIRPDHHGDGISKDLLKKMYFESVRQGYTYTVAEIMKEPIENTTSMDVHQKVGFEKIGEVTYNDGTLRNIMGRSLER